MLNYIKSELYRTFHRKYPYVLLAIGALILLGGFVLLRHLTDSYPDMVIGGSNASFLFDSLGIAPLVIGFYLSMVFVDMAFSDEYKHKTLKNVVSFGFSRNTVYFGKLTVSILLMLLSYVVLSIVYLGGAVLILGGGEGVAQGISFYLIRSALALPLFLGGLSLANMLVFHIRNNTGFAFVFAGLVMVLPVVISGLAPYIRVFNSYVLQAIYPYMMAYQFKVTLVQPVFAGADIIRCVGVGLGAAVIFCAIGAALFQRKEVN